MKTAACIALLALAASACSKNDSTQTPDDMTTSPATTDTPTQMPAVETAAPEEITTTSQPGSGMEPAQGAPGSDGDAAPAWNTNDGATAGNPQPATGAPARPDADNTRVNERDRGTALTPMDQGNGETDLKITQKIRQAVMGDGSLSFTAKNVKIITNKGTVVLRGPVNSDDERSRIDSAAKSVAGDANVINEIEIKK